MHRGYIKLYRKSEENPLYFSEVFTKWQAWSDLILIANHSEKTLSIRGNLIKINRGQIAHSEASLASRWKWSKNKVRRFINYLKTEQQIEQQQSNILNVLTIKNYDLYHSNEKDNQQSLQIDRYTATKDQKTIQQTILQQSVIPEKLTIKSHSIYNENDTTDDTTESLQTILQTDTNNNDKNDKNDKKRVKSLKFIPPTLAEIKNYISENKYHINAEDFYKYFTDGHWVDSKGNKVRNWKQKVITWENHLRADQKQAIVIKTACAMCNTIFDSRETTYVHDGKKICGKCDMKLTKERLNL